MTTPWDERYASAEYIYGTEPNAFFRGQLAALAPGRMLLPGEGEGRNAVHAASLRWDVHAFDQSAEGRRKALALAAARGVSIRYEIMDLADFACDETLREAFDAIGLFFVHLPEPLRRAVHARCAALLRPGGALLLEAFTPAQLRNASGGPKDPALLYDATQLRADFPMLDVALLEETATTLDEGSWHRGAADTVRLLARRPR